MHLQRRFRVAARPHVRVLLLPPLCVSQGFPPSPVPRTTRHSLLTCSVCAGIQICTRLSSTHSDLYRHLHNRRNRGKTRCTCFFPWRGYLLRHRGLPGEKPPPLARGSPATAAPNRPPPTALTSPRGQPARVLPRHSTLPSPAPTKPDSPLAHNVNPTPKPAQPSTAHLQVDYIHGTTPPPARPRRTLRGPNPRTNLVYPNVTETEQNWKRG